jgi:hypothetical protein
MKPLFDLPMKTHPLKRSLFFVAGLLFLAVMVLTFVRVAQARDNPEPPHPPEPMPAAGGLGGGMGGPVGGIPQAPAPTWPSFGKTLPDFQLNGLPIGEVSRVLQSEFKGAFDILVPNSYHVGDTMVDAANLMVSLQLKNVEAPEIFNAMNTYFEINEIPVRWDLTLNGNRPTAVLRSLTPLPQMPPSPPQQEQRLIIFVGDLIATDKSSGMSMDQLVRTLTDVYTMSFHSPPAPGVIQCHKEAQLIVASGKIAELRLVQETLSALREKVRLDNARNAPKPEPVQVPGQPKSP